MTSTTERITVYVPCDVVSVDAVLGYAETLSPIECTVLEAIGAGLRGIAQLHELLGLDRGVLHDLVFDLWRQGYVSLNYNEGEIRLSPDIQERIQNGTLNQLPGAESVRDRVELMIDRLIGRLRPASGSTARPPMEYEIPLSDGEFGIEDVDFGDRLRAVKEALDLRQWARRSADEEYGVATGRQLRVLGVRLDPAEIRVTGRRWLPVDVVSAIDADDRLVVTVLDKQWSAGERMLADGMLKRLVGSASNARVWRQLREKAGDGLGESPPLREAISRLADSVARAAATPAGQRRQRHLELCDEARSVSGLIAQRISSEVQARVMTGDERDDAVHRMLAAARRQVVLTFPLVKYDPFSKLLPWLREAVARDVQVVVLWGDQRDTVMQGRVRNALAELAGASSAGGSTCLIPFTSAQLRSGLIVVDDTEALLSCRGLIDPRWRAEFSVLLTGRDGRGHQPIREILRWARAAVPGYDMSRAVLVSEASFAVVANTAPEPPPAPVGTLPDFPPEEADVAAKTAVGGWAHAWRAWTDTASATVDDRVLPAARILVNGTHRELLLTAVREARRHLLIASVRIGDRAVDQRLIDDLRTCLTRGVRVTVIHGVANRNGIVNKDQAAAALQQLAEEHPGAFEVLQRTGHTPALVWDENVAFGGFDYLFDDDRPETLRRRTQWLGMHLSGGTIADTVVRTLDVDLASTQPDVPASTETAITYSVYAHVQRMLNAAASGIVDAALIDAELGEHDHPWAVLHQLDKSGATDVMRLAVARCLALHRPTAPEGAVERWRAWLVDDRWRVGEFVESAVLRCADRDPHSRPRRPLALLAAARGVPDEFEAAIFDVAADDGLSEEEKLALVCVAVAALLTQGSVTAREALELYKDTASPPWSGLIRCALGYWAEANRPLPLERIVRDAGQSRIDTALDRAWVTLRQRVDLAKALQLNNTFSRRVHRDLFGGTGMLTPVYEAAQRRDPVALRELLGKLSAIDQVIDAASAKLHEKRSIEGQHRKMLRSRLGDIVEAGNSVLAAAAADTGIGVGVGGSDDTVTRAANKVAEYLNGHLDSLRDAAAGDAVELVLARTALADLADIAEWHPRSERARQP